MQRDGDEDVDEEKVDDEEVGEEEDGDDDEQDSVDELLPVPPIEYLSPLSTLLFSLLISTASLSTAKNISLLDSSSSIPDPNVELLFSF